MSCFGVRITDSCSLCASLIISSSTILKAAVKRLDAATIHAVVQSFAKPLIIDLTSMIWNEKPASAWTGDKKGGILHASSDISMRL